MLDDLSEKVLNHALDLMATKEFQENLVVLTDNLFERYKAKMFASIGGSMKGLNAQSGDQQQFNPLALLGGRSGKVNWLQLLAMLFQGQGQAQGQAALPGQIAQNKEVPTM